MSKWICGIVILVHFTSHLSEDHTQSHFYSVRFLPPYLSIKKAEDRLPSLRLHGTAWPRPPTLAPYEAQDITTICFMSFGSKVPSMCFGSEVWSDLRALSAPLSRGSPSCMPWRRLQEGAKSVVEIQPSCHCPIAYGEWPTGQICARQQVNTSTSLFSPFSSTDAV